MSEKPPIEFRVGDRLRLRKQHPCGGFEWAVYRLGADIGIRCESCGRRVMLPRRDLERRVRSVVAQGPEETTGRQGHIARLGPAEEPEA